MADQCIVSLAAVVAPPDHHPSSAASAENSSRSVAPPAVPVAPTLDDSSSLNSIASPRQHENHDNVAQIQICGHVLHDSCLREWTEKANSCPICRQTFNLVHVYDKVGGTLLSTRTVEDKKQVAEFDPQVWIDENPEEEEARIPCPVCNRADQEEILLLCDGCDTPYHTHCIGLDSVPLGPWFCMECVDALGIENPDPGSPLQENQDARERLYYFPRTQASMRRARQRARSDEWQGAWGRIAGRIWDALSIDLDYQDDDDQVVFEGLRRSQQIRERERLEHERWQQRLNIASRMGAREVFARNIPSVLARAVPAPRPPPQEPREVQMAWGALERAREGENRKRKSRSATAEPSEPQHEPERKLKRPRTRRLPTHQNGESSATASNAAPSLSLTQTENQAPTASNGPPATVEPAPSFLSSLLKEVEMSTPSDEEKVQALYGRVPGANDVSSPAVGSPSRTSSITPPPIHAGRPSSPPTMTLSSHIEPIYPPANYSPTRSTSPNKHHSRSSSPSKRPTHESRSSPENSDSERRGSAELRQPRPRRTQPIVPPRSENVSPVRSPLPLEVKENISSIVRSALNPHWKSSKLTSEQYAAINRDISRKIYEQVQDPTAVSEDSRRTWETMANQEVARAVADLRA
ncbi:hypothetical protein B0T14DRAFT_536132 [Immersiella caudata]|uniref:PHD and RING finger domain-containing protein n=1 Tax=Immersiella caudata TaxID=314043 RepID=A0AA40C3N3_9PEZI|nr:hypothetical protein B0T14DRAFT_536132 [Immersiella caudata]